ncbi:DNA topoisomerase IV subunit A [Rhodothalassium salexigens]|uniref:DNA topoisomerase IV subunit A n=1 Tax=Rhodothalassium salexigens TaxID=1086 RepID=UPI001913E8AE|nr:DNA topoisomerase IV subunit A [Rhodothalassium salexigens]MBK5921000.1 DNA topoisomerase IV subunit A [Rhodothalassium salexigens]
MTDTPSPTDGDAIIDTPFTDALNERYLAYALSTIMARSLPDVRDGLKPVHRRLLYAMRLMKLDPDKGFKKCARVVGDVIGKYHPHGDQAVYDAMVRLAQDFAVRYPLVDGQGNFGNVDGDNAAAMRYTEARLTRAAIRLMEGLDENAVDFRETYDGEEEEPVVLPAAFPNLLANGASGIAVGMATSIPPHNAAELIDACQVLIKARRGVRGPVSHEDLLALVPGPDFPTGGLIVEPRASIAEAYATGRGGFRLRARWHTEDLGRGQYHIVVTEIPYSVGKSKLIERIADLIHERKLPILADVRDESTDEVRVVLEPKSRSVDATVLMESLFKLCDLEIRYSLNLNVIDLDGRPRVLSLGQALEAFLDHRLDVLKRRTGHRLDKIARRLEILDGYLVAYLNLDEVIRIIREEDEPKAELMRAFSLTDTQAEAILNMRLRALRKLEEIEIRKEHDALSAEQAELQALMADPGRQWRRLASDLDAVRADFGPDSPLGARRTGFAEADARAAEIPLEAMVEREPVTIVCSRRGWIRALAGHLDADKDLTFKEGDEERFRFHAHTTDYILAFTSAGRMHTILADKLPGGRGHGEPLRLIVELDGDEDLVALLRFEQGRDLVLASSEGRGFRVEAEKCLAQTKTGRHLMNLRDGVRATHCLVVEDGQDTVAVIGRNRKLLVFDLDEVPHMTRGRGVILQKYRDATLSDLTLIKAAEGLSWPMGGHSGRVRTETDLTPWRGRRGAVGKIPPQGFPRSNRFDG